MNPREVVPHRVERHGRVLWPPVEIGAPPVYDRRRTHSAPRGFPMADHAELIFTAGRVHTVNATNDVAPALAVAEGRVLAVGSDADVRALAGPGTRVIELKGRSLLPGFIDAHAHLAGLGMAETAID